MNAVTHLEKVITGEVSAVTHLEKVIAGEVSAVTYTEKVITGEATPITHLQKVIAGEASPVTHLEYIWAGGSPTPTEHEYTGAVPVTFNADGEPLLDYLISGNMSQTGTPTPQNPIQPSECGERTGNLVRFYKEEMQGRFYGVDVTVKNAEITLNGTVTIGSGHWVEIGYKFDGETEPTDNVLIPCEPETPYTIATEILDGDSTQVRIIAFSTFNETRIVNIGSSLTTTFSSDINRIFISLGAGGVVFNNLKFRVMFNKGSAPLPYEPYGIKIPISSANTTTPVYLGEVETTRKIKKYVFTGVEGWQVRTSPDNSYYINYSAINIGSGVQYQGICSHFDNPQSGVSKITSGQCYFGTSAVSFRLDDTTDLTQWTNWVAQQYAAGTPVTVWYVLAEPTTGIVNEPLRKIGDYADTVSMSQAGVSIPTNNGSTTVDVDTTLKPSEVYIKYKGV